MLSFNNVTFRYSSTPLFKDLSFKLDSPFLCHLVGKNGSGKSTFLKLCSKLLTPEVGKVTAPKKIALVSHECMAFAYLSVLENLNFFLKIQNINHSKDALLQKWDLKKSQDTLVVNLSQGEKLKFSLLLSFLEDADLLILDEPTASLDTESTKIFFGELNEFLSNKTKSLIFASHHQEDFALYSKFKFTHQLKLTNKDSSSSLEVISL